MNRKAIIGIVATLILVVIAGATIFMSSGGSEIDKKIELANKYITEGKYEEARLAFEEILKIDENNVEARVGLSKAYIGLEDYTKAEEVLRKGLDIDNKQVVFWDALIELYKETGKTDEELMKLLAEAYDNTGDEKYSKMIEECESKLSGESSSELSGESKDPSAENTKGETETNSEELIPLDDPEKVITFVDPVFEQAVRDLYELGDGEIRWKDIGYRDSLVFRGYEEGSRNHIPTEYVQLTGAINSIEDSKWFLNLKNFQIICYESDWKVSGDITVLSKLKNLEIIFLGGSQVSGDIGSLAGLKNIKTFNFEDCNVRGDIAVLANYKNLSHLDLMRTGISGDISVLGGLSKLKLIAFDGGVGGDIASLSNLTDLMVLILDRTQVYGDLSAISGLENLVQATFNECENITGTLTLVNGQVVSPRDSENNKR